MLWTNNPCVSSMCTKAPELHVELHKHGMSQQAMMGGGPAASSTSTRVSSIIFVPFGIKFARSV